MLKDKVAINAPVTVAEIRALMGQTQQEFARAINMPYSTYVRKEYGESPWKQSEIETIHLVSGIPLYFISSKVEE